MSDQAAAEALVAVGRSRLSAASSPHPSPGHAHPADDDADDAPRRKRARRKAPAPAPADDDREREHERERERKRPWFPAAHHSGPFDLPPLERAFPPFPGPGTPGAAGYMRSASAGSGSVPSRGGAGSPAGGASAGGYTLPPVRTGYYPGNGSGGHEGIAMAPPVPTVEELERHYFQLHEQRRKTEELLRETDRVMAGVKRGLDEMRAGAEGGSAGSGGGGPELVPLRERERGRSREHVGGPSVWPVSNEAARE